MLLQVQKRQLPLPITNRGSSKPTPSQNELRQISRRLFKLPNRANYVSFLLLQHSTDASFWVWVRHLVRSRHDTYLYYRKQL